MYDLNSLLNMVNDFQATEIAKLKSQLYEFFCENELSDYYYYCCC